MIQSAHLLPELPPLPRVTSYGAEAEMPISQDFYRPAAPFMTSLNKLLEIGMMVLGIAALALLLFVGLFKSLSETYVTDGTNACKIAPVSTRQPTARM